MTIDRNIYLNDREQDILRTIVHLYILNASPIGSKFLSKFVSSDKKLSSATIRNVMKGLEEMGFISHPHTSAGRVPTDKGYRFYVDSLMDMERLSDLEKRAVKDFIRNPSENVLKEASKVLGMLSRYLSVVEIPHIKDLIVERLELVRLSSNRLLVVLALDSNNVKTLTLEADFEIDYGYLTEICSYINEKISGKPLSFLRKNFDQIIVDFELKDQPLIRLFVESVNKIFDNHGSEDKLLIAGTQNLLSYPEFADLEKVRTVIEIIENEDIIVHLLDKIEDSDNSLKVFIGNEMNNNTLADYSFLVSEYSIGSAKGAIGLIGPKRMNYAKMMSLVNYVSKVLNIKG